MKQPFKQILRTFLTGALTVLPLAATLALFGWIIQILAAWLGPDSLFGSLLVAIGLSVTTSRTIGYMLGLLALMAAIYLLGVLVESELQRGIRRMIDALVRRIPLVRTVYDLATRMVELMSNRSPDGMKSMQPVWLYFGGKPAAPAGDPDASATPASILTPGATDGEKPTPKAAVLALLCTAVPVMLEGHPYHGVLIPSAPVPVGGGLLYVPADWVVPADVGMEGLTSIYVSMGLTTAQYVKPQE